MKFPAIHYLTIQAIQHFHHWYLPHDSPVTFNIEKLEIDVGFDLILDDRGYLDPKIWDVKVDFGESVLEHDSVYVRMIMHQSIELAKVIL